MVMPNADNVTLRAATAEYPELAATLIRDTDPHIFDYLHQHDPAFLRAHLGFQWQQPDSLFSHRFAVAACWEGGLAGISLGFSRDEQAAAGEAFIARAMAFMNEAQLAHLAAWSEYGRYVLPPVPEDAWYLQHLAVVPEARGRGVGERLLVDSLERAGRAGFARMHLDLYADNAALRLYERLGFRTIVETRVLPLVEHGIDLHLRMERKL